ncbi:MAG TPA: proton-conducting transporter membrane subunit, partial [Paraburkholderia sp.]
FWLPQAYRSAIGPVAALFAIMTKVGVYAMLRCDALVFGGVHGVLGDFMHDWVWWLAIATIVFGALGALAVQSLKATTGYALLVSVGLLIAALSMQTVTAWSALLYYLVSTTLCTAALFVLADVLERQPQTPEAADELGPRGAVADFSTAPAPSAPSTASTPSVPAAAIASVPGVTPPPRAAALLFLVAAIGAIGLPPLSGFLGKAMVLAATPLPRAVVLWPVVLVSGLVLIVALSRTGTRILWAIPASYGAAPPPATSHHRHRNGSGTTRARLAACALLLACVVAVTLGAGPLKQYLDATAAQLSDRAAYVDAVLDARR